jgi:hypothetical protein
MDIAWFPDHFAHDRRSGDEAVARVLYSRPQKKGRDIFGDLVPYGKVWRTGANEAAEILVYKDIKIGGKKLEAGRYALFTIPDKKEWTLIFSSDLDYWGAYSYNQANDVLRVKAKAKSSSNVIEAFSIGFDQNNMYMGWDKTYVEISVEH